MLSETVSKVLYPSDAVQQGRELRLLQEYFFVACALHDVMRHFVRRGEDIHDFPSKVAIQLNDTHPALAVAELMRMLVDQQGLEWDEAWEITRETIAYTNHTLMPEALEQWPVSLLDRVVPRHLQIIQEIDRRFINDVCATRSMSGETVRRISIIEDGHDGRGAQVRMAHLAVVGSHSINGVSELHSELVKTRLMPEFYDIWPKRFSNKTNGVTQRRWLLAANPALAVLLDETIGPQWTTNLDHLIGLERFADDSEFQRRFRAIKLDNKMRLATEAHRIAEVDIDPMSIFDVQAKRIHEYKRQLLMALGIVHEYLSLIEDGIEPPLPRVYVMAGKAAPGYWAAKMIIKLIGNLAEVINNDERTRGLIKVAFMPDYRVSLAEKIIPAADVSEQISTAGMEASGTGNMKFAMNGALIIGTLDGANIEIKDAVGDDNIIYLWTKVRRDRGNEVAAELPSARILQLGCAARRVLDELASNRFCPKEPGLFSWIRDMLLSHDAYFVVGDFGAYADTQAMIAREYTHRDDWTRKAILNVARMGRFSSDRTVSEYAREIWHLERV